MGGGYFDRDSSASGDFPCNGHRDSGEPAEFLEVIHGSLKDLHKADASFRFCRREPCWLLNNSKQQKRQSNRCLELASDAVLYDYSSNVRHNGQFGRNRLPDCTVERLFTCRTPADRCDGESAILIGDMVSLQAERDSSGSDPEGHHLLHLDGTLACFDET